MKWFIRLSVLLITAYALFIAYRSGLNDGRAEANSVAVAMEAAGRRNAIVDAAKIIGNASIWEDMTLEGFRDYMSQMEARGFADLQRAFQNLPPAQRQRVIDQLFSDFSEDEERALWRTTRRANETKEAQQAGSSNGG